MKVITTVVGVVDPPEVVWPEGWPIPSEGDTVELGNGPLYGPLHVRTVVWYPHGVDRDNTEPFVYLVIGLRRRDGLAY